MTWYEARRSCVDAGGDLLRVDDDILLNYLASWLYQAQARWWIDGVNEVWNWDKGEPPRTSVSHKPCSKCSVIKVIGKVVFQSERVGTIQDLR